MLGFARVSPYSDRCVYAGVGEHGVYVARAARGRQVGRRLLEALAAASEQAGLYKLTSRVFADNAASRAVHLAAGFTRSGSSGATAGSTASGRTACSSSGCSARPRTEAQSRSTMRKRLPSGSRNVNIGGT